jgi:hypothetical protein
MTRVTEDDATPVTRVKQRSAQTYSLLVRSECLSEFGGVGAQSRVREEVRQVRVAEHICRGGASVDTRIEFVKLK